MAVLALCDCAAGSSTHRRTLLPGIVLIDRSETYDVDGRSIAELVTSIRERGPRIDDHGFGARTHWSVRWRYGYRAVGAECRPTQIDLELEIVVTLPVWRPGPEVAPDVVARWEAFSEGLSRHEAGHRDNAVEAARRVRDAVREARAVSCVEMEREVNRAAREIVARHHQRDLDYDRETDHGRTQGAVLDSIAGRQPGI